MGIECTECGIIQNNPEGLVGVATLERLDGQKLEQIYGRYLCLSHVQPIIVRLQDSEAIRKQGEEEVYRIDEHKCIVYPTPWEEHSLSITNPPIRVRRLGYLPSSEVMRLFQKVFYQDQVALGRIAPKHTEKRRNQFDLFVTQQAEEEFERQTGLSIADHTLKKLGSDAEGIRIIRIDE